MVSGASDGSQVRRGLQNCEFVVVEDVFESETSHSADVHLPGVTFAEKTGTFTNTERRGEKVRLARPPRA